MANVIELKRCYVTQKGFLITQKEEMETRLKSKIFKENTVVKTYSKDFVTDDLQEEVQEINNEIIKGISREIQLNGIYLSIRDVTTNKGYQIDVSHDFPLFKLHFEIEGSNRYTPFNSKNQSIYIPHGHYNLFYLPEVNGTLSYKTKRRKTLEIKFTEDYIKKIIGEDFKSTLKDFGHAIDKKQPFVMWESSKRISSELQNTIQEIIKCKYTGTIKKAYLEAKVMELLVVLLAKTRDDNYKKMNIELPKPEYVQILKVEKFIKQNLNKTLTIPELATLAGFNTSKLKRDFKIIFSTTIFKYITELRMIKARKLILDDGTTITQASYEVGYKNPQHFTVAFKKKYGYLPSSLNKV